MPSKNNWLVNRREAIRGIAGAGGVLALPNMFRPGQFAEELQLTPALAEGPFYPDRLPLDTDNDLLIINDSINPGVGSITHLGGRILGESGEPIRGALVEIWQVDNHGSYIHSSGGNSDNENRRDANFQGYGRFLTDRKGQYYFRTIKPVSYGGRTPHVHFRISVGNKQLLSTQMMISDHAMNDRDDLLKSITDKKQRSMLLADFKPIEGSKISELSVDFDLVVGYTPEDDH